MTEMDIKPKVSPVKTVLAEYSQGDAANYKRLLLQLQNPRIEPGVLIAVLNQLEAMTFLLTHQYESLVVTVLRIDWVSQNIEVQKAYKSLIVSLVSAQPTYLHHVLHSLVVKLSPETFLQSSPDSSNTAGSHAKFKSWLELCYVNVHGLIQSLIPVIPMLPGHLLKALQRNLPSISSSHEVQVGYIRNLFHVTSYLPELTKDSLEVVVNRITELDVHCPKEDIWVNVKEVRDDAEEVETTQFDMDDVTHEVDTDLTSKKESTEEAELRLTDVAQAIDCLMHTLLTYCKETCYNNGGLQNGEAKALLLNLFQVFVKTVLPTHLSNHVQYFLFYICSFSKPFVDAFLEHLWKQFVDPNVAPVIRQSAASYMASFLARANYIPLGTLTASLELMVKWLHSYIDNQELSSKVNQDVNMHRPFYSLCQAIFYVIVYHYKDLLGSEKGIKFVMSLNLDRIISCKLNPLRFCLPSIVNIFATITRKYQVVFCYTIIERNARCLGKISDVTSSGCLIDVNNPLDTFFPFDPYHLPMSGQLINPLYRQWEGIKSSDNTFSKQIEEEEDEFRIYEEHLQEVPLGLMASSLSAVSPGFMSP